VNALPTVFVSHGAPTLALAPGATGDAWEALASDLPKPKAVLAVSAHWETASPEVSSTQHPQTIHDFYGFPEPLFQLQYPAPGAPWLAERVRVLLEAAGIPILVDGNRGIDHGTWVPMGSMYPQADVPVVQLSVQTRLGPKHHVELGRALSSLASEGVLILGSGSMTHNLREVRWGVDDPASAPAYVGAFQTWVQEALEARRTEDLIAYRTLAPEAPRAHPTEEHFFPLFVAWGAAGLHPKPVRRFAGITEGVLAMDVYTFDPAG
jgi:4,5-DOPA dioxygenase extradiol